MRQSASLFFKSLFEFVPKEDISSLPQRIRGIYALYNEDNKGFKNLMYVGMTDSGAKGRLIKHNGGKKEGLWTHCSVYEAWDNITQEQIAELEALFRHALRKDASASSLNIQKGSSIFMRLRKETNGRTKNNAA